MGAPLALVIGGVALALPACSEGAAAPAKDGAAVPAKEGPAKGASRPQGAAQALPVRLFPASPQKLETKVPATGTLLARESVALVSELSRRLVDIRVEEGSRVKRGDVLFVLDSSDLSARLRQLKVQQKLAKSVAAREAKLYEQGLTPTSQRDEVMARVEDLEAQQRVLAAELAKTTIRAPFDGTLGLRQVSKGAWLSPQVVLTTLHDTSQLKLDFALPERYASMVQAGRSFHFRVEGSTKTFEGKVTAFEPRVDSTSRSILVRGVVEAEPGLMPGSFAQVELTISDDQAILIPSIAVLPGLDGRRVFVLKDGVARSVLVEVGSRDAEQVEITSGLSPGDQVIISNLLRLKDGSPVRPESEAQ
ncbi:MAG: efflux RND transporter periplasmic adaptor subunit [Polyangiaceae bacterium]|nr:efflux RND transporter periplasmic adaptor subunit [Polyangiaceae bacterium]MCW5789871.1 efflux RND transporter periplasmic adaptor subunit [Polyangiaceae bacterium]